MSKGGLIDRWAARIAGIVYTTETNCCSEDIPLKLALVTVAPVKFA